jgi:hypothetical protein
MELPSCSDSSPVKLYHPRGKGLVKIGRVQLADDFIVSRGGVGPESIEGITEA